MKVWKFPSIVLALFLLLSPAIWAGEYLQVGYAEVDITPEITRWVDSDGNGKYTFGDGSAYDTGERVLEFAEGDIYIGNGEGLAHYVHDPLYARVLVLEDPITTNKVALVSLDLYMLQIDDSNYIKELVRDLNFDHIAIHCTHNHMGPDTLGRSGPDPFTSGINGVWFRKMQRKTAQAIRTALAKRVPARLRFLSTKCRYGLYDTRDPFVLDDDLLAMQAVNYDGKIVATLVQWANHVEAILSIQKGNDAPEGIKEKKGHILTAGFPYAMSQRAQEVFQSPALFFNGAVGGLMTMLHTFVWEPNQPYSPDTPIEEIPEDYPGKIHDNFRMADLIGYELVNKLQREGIEKQPFETQLDIASKVVAFKSPVENLLFIAGFSLGIIGYDERKIEGDIFKNAKITSQVSRIDIGPAQIICVPGEIVPELTIGLPPDFYAKNSNYFKNPENHKTGKDFVVRSPIKKQMRGKYRMIFGLTNDSLGYMVAPCDFKLHPEFPWVKEAKDHYEETQSLGRDNTKIVMDAIEELLSE